MADSQDNPLAPRPRREEDPARPGSFTDAWVDDAVSSDSASTEEFQLLADAARREREALEAKERARRREYLEPSSGELADLISASIPHVRLTDLVLYDTHRESLEIVVTEQRSRDRLRSYALKPTRLLSLVGPCGTGRAMTTAALAGELNLPLFTIQLERLISGRQVDRQRKLRLLAETMERTRGVYLLDFSIEDGVDSARLASAQRSLLQDLFFEFDRGEVDSPFVLLLSSSDQLDDALTRRFEASIHFFRPTRPVIEELIRRRLARFDIGEVRFRQVVARAGELNHADITRACERAAKGAILRGTRVVEHVELIRALDEERRHTRR